MPDAVSEWPKAQVDIFFFFIFFLRFLSNNIALRISMFIEVVFCSFLPFIITVYAFSHIHVLDFSNPFYLPFVTYVLLQKEVWRNSFIHVDETYIRYYTDNVELYY